MSHSDRTFAWGFGAFVVAALATFTSAALFGGCQSQPCTNTSLNSDDPSPAIECPSGELCYRGRCIRACSAGQERAQRCTSDDDCDTARPRCVDEFCSVCDFGEQCIPVLNICQAVEDVDIPEPPAPPPDGLRPPTPLDGGPLDGGSYLDGGLSRIQDAGMQGPLPEAEVTHVGFVDLAYEEDYRMGAPPVGAVRASVVGYDVRGNGNGLRWRADLTPPRIQCEDDDDDRDQCGARQLFTSGACEIRPLRTVTSSGAQSRPPIGANLGDVQIDDHVDFPMSIRQPITATFVAPQYQLSPAQPSLPQDLLVWSAATFDQHYLSVTGSGVMGITNGAWPNPPQGVFLGHHVPFLLEPSMDSLSLLTTRTTVTNPPAADLYFQWNRIDTGNDSFERVIVRILGADNELFCDALEGRSGEDTIQIRADILSEWRRREPAAVYPLYFERASAQRLDVSEIEPNLFFITVRVRHTLIGEIQFE